MSYNPPPVEAIIDPTVKNAFLYAHQDDELQYVGLMSRLSANTRYLWVTNGDGLAPMENADPEEYAQLRLDECAKVVELLGVPEEKVVNLKRSEIQIYNYFIDWVEFPEKRTEITDFLEKVAREMYEFLKADIPQNVFVPAYQGGHPEHDLTSAFTGLALRKLHEEGLFNGNLIHLPEYEYTILIPMRFKPWYKGAIYSIDLTSEEVAIKEQVLDIYESQKKLFASFKKVMNGIGKVTRLVGKKMSWEDFGAKETFGPIPLSFNYTKNTHLTDFENYINDDCRGKGISFTKMIGPIVASVEQRMQDWK